MSIDQEIEEAIKKESKKIDAEIEQLSKDPNLVTLPTLEEIYHLRAYWLHEKQHPTGNHNPAIPDICLDTLNDAEQEIKRRAFLRREPV